MGMYWGVRPARKAARFSWVFAAAALAAGLFPQAVAFADHGTPAPGRAQPFEAKAATAKPSTALADLPRGASQDWWSGVRRGLTSYEYRPSKNTKGLQAPNRAHNLRTYFGPTGIRLHDRTAAGSPELAALTLAGIGRGAALAPVAAGNVTQVGKRIEIRRPGIVEWYENTPKGLEQGFTLAARAEGEGPLVLELAVERARARLIGESIELATDSGRRLRYGKLFAEDATGRILVSRLEAPSPDRLRLVVDDSGARYPVVIDPLIEGLPDAILESNQLGSSGVKPSAFGVSVSGAGDVNGDGFGDVIVGAWGWDGGESEEGAAFVFLGSLSGIVGTDPATAHARIESNQAQSRLGRSVSGAGDVNGDGFDDIVVGAYLYRNSLFFEGEGSLRVDGAAFVFLGSAGGIVGTDPLTAHATIISHSLSAFLGFSVSDAGDIDGDGFDDIIVGVPREGIPFGVVGIPPNDRQGTGGAALVFRGGLDGITGTGFADADTVLLPYPPGFPELVGGGFGGSVSGAGDVNGDGFADVIVGMTGDGGAAFVFTGSAAGIVGTDPATADTAIVSDAIVPLGDRVSGAGDVNGDGFADIILGAPRFPIPAPGFSPSLEGAVLVFLGGPQGIAATGPADAQAMFQGIISVSQLGWDVSAAGDVDGDGFDDVIAAALGYAGGLNQEGAAYVFRGGPQGIVGASLRDDAYVRLESKQSRAAINTVDVALSASGIGDVDGDGFADVMLGTGFYDNGEVNEGAAFVYHGGPAPAVPNRPPVPDAGADQTVYDIDNSGSATITVDGSLSFDPDGSIVSYAWYDGETLLGTSPVLTTALSTTGLHTLVLTVTDDGGITRGDPVEVSILLVDRPFVSFDDFSSAGFAGGFGWAGNWIIGGNVSLSSVDTFPTPPQARVGAGATLSRAATLPAGATGLMLKFNAKASQFGPSDQVAVQVSRDGGPFTTVKTFTVADSDDAYRFYGGTVGDGRITLSWYPATAADMVLRFASAATTGRLFVDDIEVTALAAPPGLPLPPAGELPVANAGADTAVDDTDGDGIEVVTLDGILSFDPDGVIVSYQWFDVTLEGTLPIGIGATLNAPFGHGSHTVQLIVTDNAGGSTSDTVAVTVNQVFPNNQPPVASAGPDQTIVDTDGNTLEVVSFDGSASTDPDGTIVSYIWTKNGNLFNNAASFSITLPFGVHTVDLTVTDNQGATSTDTVVITVVPGNSGFSIDSFTATPAVITVGESTTLSWTTTNANSVSINGGASLPLDGSLAVSPTTNTVYTLSVTGPGGTAIRSVTVGVNPAPTIPPSVDSFSAGPNPIAAGGTATLSWTTTGADSVSIDNGVGAGLPADGGATVSPATTTTYTLTATGPGGTTTSGVTVTVSPASPQPPTVNVFSAAPATIAVGETATLIWTTTSADSVSIDNGVGAGLPASGSRTVSPATTTTYTLTATGPGGTATSNIAVTVDTASGEALTITRFDFQAGKNEWRIEGTSSIPGPGNILTLYMGATAPGPVILGTAAVDGSGFWNFREKNTSLAPDGNGTISIQSSQGGTWEGISGVGPVPGGNPSPTPSPTVDSFSAAPTSITAGGSATLSWTTTGAASVSINGGASLTADGGVTVSPAATTTYSLTATGAGGTATSSVTVTVTVNPAPPAPPSVDSFAASPATIAAGGAATLSWTTTGAGSVSINGGVGLPADGAVTVNPAATTTYSLTATGPGGTAISSITVMVNSTPPQGSVAISGPASVDRGGPVSLTVTLTNMGTSTLINVELSFNASPDRRIKNLSPGGRVAVGNVPPGSSVSQTWTGDADKEGPTALTAEAFGGGVSIGTATGSLTVVK